VNQCANFVVMYIAVNSSGHCLLL